MRNTHDRIYYYCYIAGIDKIVAYFFVWTGYDSIY